MKNGVGRCFNRKKISVIHLLLVGLIMGEQFKLDSNGTCLSCNTVAATKENLQCYLCEGVFHGACSTMSEDDKVGSKSLISAFFKRTQLFCSYCDGI